MWKIRGVPVKNSENSYIPPIQIESIVKERITEIINSEIEMAIDLGMYCMKTQIFIDKNKRASVIFANHYLILHG